ncbi:type II CRISPR RNA-guided endonuclease Cas9 [Aquirufa nivalisilvae]|uniref:type II CRISPR RNA-guided endonuclease Cas9 n=1 Tax=Aquirufa nivalisilvae TaxID=2516557 RepID=UPI0022A9440D|nr:type II CRISPR RNA-guided endonuclease Cas9 [Aquirufa nivalisilvae]MCZ2482075.1 type II CRISPR RNA-guided endonuclease Cas9 [Aquirufa nivalisilvae]
MKKILGLDLGSTSVGWAFIQEDDSVSKIVGAGVRVVPISTDEANDFQKGNAISINKNRTLARGARRGLQRFKLRRDAILNIFKSTQFISSDFKYAEVGKGSTHQSYALRAKSATDKISPNEFVQVLLMLNKKRGYKSSRKGQDASADGVEDLGQAIDGMEVAKQLYEKNLTPGQYIFELLQKNSKAKIPDFYSSDLENEIEKIINSQCQFHPDLPNDLLTLLKSKSEKATYFYFNSTLNIAYAEIKGNRDEKRLQAYTWRTNALSEKIAKEELAYIIGEIKSGISKSSGYLGGISNRSKELIFNNLTVGQYQYQKLLQNPLESQRNMVFLRTDYLHEFERIWETQKQFYPALTDELKKEVRDVTIFYQRKLKSQKHLISFCELIPNHRVAPRSSPIFQEFRLLQNINDIKIKNESFEIDEDVRKGIYDILSNTGRLKNTELLKLIGANPKIDELNFKEIQGNTTRSEFIKVFKNIWEDLGNDTKSLENPLRVTDVSRILSDLSLPSNLLDLDLSVMEDGFDKQPFYQLWHLLYTVEDDDVLIKNLEKRFGLPMSYAKALLSVRLEPNYGSLSTRAMRKILPHMEEGVQFSDAVVLGGFKSHSKSSITKEENEARILKDKLDLVKKNSLRNPVVEKILNQTINVVNAIIESSQYGKPDEIRIELARELRANNEQRKNMTSVLASATKENDEIRNKLRTEFHVSKVTKNDIIRYKLWMETGGISLYTGKPIQASSLFSNEYDIDHIIPQSRLFDDSFSNKTLCERAWNIEKGNQTAYSFLKQKLSPEEFEQFLARVKELVKGGKIKRTKYDKLNLVNENIPDDFINRQLNETQYIAKKAKELLLEVCRNVFTTTGSITDRLREDWGLTDVMKELNFEKYQLAGLTYEETGKNGERLLKIMDWTKRNDHRHHAMDAITIALTKQAYIQYLNNLNSKENGVLGNVETKYIKRVDGKMKFEAPMPNIRQEFKKALENILVSHKAKNKVVTRNVNYLQTKDKSKKVAIVQLTPRGQLHKETVYGKKQVYSTSWASIGLKFNADLIAKVAKKNEREALMKRLLEFDNDPKKAFIGKNSLANNPIYLDDTKSQILSEKVKLVEWETIYTKRVAIGPDLDVKKINKIIDPGVRQKLMDRLDTFGGDAKKAFSNLDENPIFLDKAQKIAIKRVTMSGVNNVEALHTKKDLHGNLIFDDQGKAIPTDFVSTGNNHHVAIFEDYEGNLQEEIVSFYEAVSRASAGVPIIQRQHENGWKFLFTMKQNEFFVFPSEEFDPSEIDLLNPENYSLISENLYRVQKFTTKYYVFRHHLETNVEDTNQLLGITWKRITMLNRLKKVFKIRLNHLGQIVKVGE